MIIHIGSIDLVVDYDFINSLDIVSEQKIGDTYYVYLSDNSCFHCHMNFWLPYRRENKINQILN